MARRSILAAATVAFLAFGANATPCRPTSALTSSTTLVESSSTVIKETSSTAVVETSTTLVESSSVTASSSTLAETSSSTTLAETSTTTLAETSTTSQAPVCTVTQVLVNPSFDDGDGSPWTGVSSSRSEESPRTGRYNLYVIRPRVKEVLLADIVVIYQALLVRSLERPFYHLSDRNQPRGKLQNRILLPCCQLGPMDWVSFYRLLLHYHTQGWKH